MVPVMRWIVILAALLLAACSADNHSFVVDIEKADKKVASAVVMICEAEPKALQRIGNVFVGRVVVACGEGEGRVRLTNTDGTITDCRIGYLTSMDDWWVFDVLGSSCTAKSKGEPYGS